MDILTTPLCEVKRLESLDVALLPWGATEPHNLHLPYGTDTILAHEFSVRAADRVKDEYGVNAVVLPAIPLGSQNPGQRDMPFCLHARYETQRAILGDIVESLDHQGINKLVIVNGHGGNCFKNMFRDLALDYPDFTIVVCDWFAIVKQADFFENPDDHAGEMESSVMMHFYPDFVDLSEAGSGEAKPFALNSLRTKIGWLPRSWSKVTADTGIGDPRKASAKKGERCAEWTIQQITQLIYELSTQEVY